VIVLAHASKAGEVGSSSMQRTSSINRDAKASGSNPEPTLRFRSFHRAILGRK
jgi:hypothetical protein